MSNQRVAAGVTRSARPRPVASDGGGVGRGVVRNLVRRAFSVVELTIATLIVALLATTLILIFRSNLSSWKWGQTHMAFNTKIQLTMKQVFTDIKAIGPAIGVDQLGTLMFQGEKIGDLFPNLVVISDYPQDTSSGGRRLDFSHYDLDNPGARTRLSYYLNRAAPDQPPRLIREVVDPNGGIRQKVVAEHVSDLFFERNPLDIHEVRVRMTIADDENPTLVERLEFAVHLDTNLVCVK